MNRKRLNEESEDGKSMLSESVAASSVRDAKELSASDSSSGDEIDPSKLGKSQRISVRNIGQSQRRMSLNRGFSIKSTKTNLELQKKNEIAQQEANLVDFETAGNKEQLNFFELAKIVKKNITESIILAMLKKEKSKLRRYDSINGIFSLVLITLYVIEYEIFIYDIGKKKFSSNVFNHLFRFVMLGLSACVCFVQYFHYDSLLKIEKILKLRDQRETIRTSGFLKYLILECAFNSIICPPFIDVGVTITQLRGTVFFSLDGVCFLLCLLRFYNVLKVPEQYSIWTTEESTKICKQYKFTPNTSFLVKAELARRPYIVVFLSLAVTMVLFGLGVRIFEVSYTEVTGSSTDQFFHSTINTFWFIIVTMVTVGYGDGYPRTHVGRFIVLWVGVVGTLLVSLFLVALSSSSALSSGEIRVFNKVDFLSMKRRAQKSGAELLYSVFLMHLSSKRARELEGDESKQQELNKEVLFKFVSLSRSKAIVSEFKTIYFQLKTLTSIPEDLILDLLENNEQKFREVYSKTCKVSFIQDNCSKIIQNQKEIQESLEGIVSTQHRIAAFLVKINLLYQSNTA